MLELQAEVEEMDERAKKRAEKRREAGRRVFSEEDAQAAATLASTSTQALAAAPIPHHPLPAPYDYYTGIIRAHPYHTQVEKDIARSMAHLDVTKGYKQKQRTLARGALARVIHAIFSLHPDLHYVQGFHDIASVFLLVCATGGANQANFSLPANSRGEELAFLLTERLACLHIRDSLRPSLETVVQVLSLLFPLLLRADPDVYELLTGAQVPSFFTLSWLLTWFSHNLDRVSDASRVFDFFLAAHPLAPLYATAALILQMKEGLMNLKTKAIETARAEYEKENAEWMTTKRNGKQNGSASAIPSLTPFDPSSIQVDMTSVHDYFQHLPPLLDLDALFLRTRHLLTLAPPPLLLAQSGVEREIPADSPLRIQADNAEQLGIQLQRFLKTGRVDAGVGVGVGVGGGVRARMSRLMWRLRLRCQMILATVRFASASRRKLIIRRFQSIPHARRRMMFSAGLVLFVAVGVGVAIILRTRWYSSFHVSSG